MSNAAFSDFAAALLARKEEIVERLVGACIEALGGTRGVPDDVFRADRASDVDDMLETLGSSTTQGTPDRWRRWLDVAIERGFTASTMQVVHGVLREVLVDVGLALQAEGVPRATAGIRRLVRSSSEGLYLIDEELRMRADKAQRKTRIFEALMRNSPDGIGVATLDGTLLYANPALERMMGSESLVGRPIYDLVPPEEAELQRREISVEVLSKGAWSGQLRYRRDDGSTLEAQVTAFLARDEQGAGMARCAFIRDLTVARRAEEERRMLAAEVIAAQKQALEELETPLVPIAEGVLVMPLVGDIDPSRAERMLGVLLEGIDRQHAKVVILDLTGVSGADAEAAEALVRAAQAARLLGTEVVTTGTGPEVARTFVEVGADLSAIETRGTLGDGVTYALRKVKGR